MKSACGYQAGERCVRIFRWQRCRRAGTLAGVCRTRDEAKSHRKATPVAEVLQRLLHNVCTHACVYGRGGAEAAPVAELLQRRPDPVLFTTKTKDVKGVTIDASSAASFANDSTPALPHRVHLACEASHNRIPNTTDTHIRCTCKHKHTHTHTDTACIPAHPCLGAFLPCIERARREQVETCRRGRHTRSLCYTC